MPNNDHREIINTITSRACFIAVCALIGLCCCRFNSPWFLVLLLFAWVLV